MVDGFSFDIDTCACKGRVSRLSENDQHLDGCLDREHFGGADTRPRATWYEPANKAEGIWRPTLTLHRGLLVPGDSFHVCANSRTLYKAARSGEALCEEANAMINDPCVVSSDAVTS
jgi:hypothetical protein